MEFKAIETKEEFDEAIKEPIRLAQEEVRKEYETYMSPEQVEKKYKGYLSEKEVVEKYKDYMSPEQVAEKYKDYLSKEDVDSKIKAYEVEKLRTKIALDNGLPYEFTNRLQGEDEKSILEDALSIAKLIKGNRSVLPLKNSEGGIDPKRESFKRLVSVLKED